jgi:hypothetical protein
MTPPSRRGLINHDAVAQTGSFEVRFSDGRPSEYFYWDDVAGRRLSADQMTSEQALEAAQRSPGSRGTSWHELEPRV